MRHPAKYNDKFLPIFEELLKTLPESAKVLDPFAGTGKIHNLKFNTIGIEIEREWASMHPETIWGDSTNMPIESNTIDAICTSPTYGNRMADHHIAKDKTKRNTYRHILGRELTINNSGMMQWGEEYKNLHNQVYKECKRVLKNSGLFILNMKNHIRKSKEVKVWEWHIQCLESLGFVNLETRKIETSGNGFGKNRKLRTKYEFISLLILNNK